MSTLPLRHHDVTVNFKVRLRILPILFAQVINKHIRMSVSINSESLTEMT